MRLILFLSCIIPFVIFGQLSSEINESRPQEILTIENQNFEKSFFITRINFDTKVLAAGRVLGNNISQRQFTPYFGYFHKSGLFVEIATQFNTETRPSNNFNFAGFGYLKEFSWGTLVGLAAERYFDNSSFTGSSPIPMALTANLSQQIGLLSLTMDYSVLMNSSYSIKAQRLRPSLTFFIPLEGLSTLDRISIFPTLGILLAHSSITDMRFNELGYYLDLINKGQSINDLKIRRKSIKSQLANPNRAVPSPEFGLMSVDFSLPLRLTWKEFSFTTTYHIVKPFPLPDEDISYGFDIQHFVSFNLSYLIK